MEAWIANSSEETRLMNTAKFLLITFFNENLFCSVYLCINFYKWVYFLYLYHVFNYNRYCWVVSEYEK